MVIVNSGEEAYLERYAGDGAKPVEIDGERIRPGVKVISATWSRRRGVSETRSHGTWAFIAKLISGKDQA